MTRSSLSQGLDEYLDYDGPLAAQDSLSFANMVDAKKQILVAPETVDVTYL